MKYLKKLRKIWFAAVAAAMIPLLAACGGGGGENRQPDVPAPEFAHTVGGTITGLSGTVILRVNNGSSLTLNGTNGPFAFNTLIADGSPYNVTVFANPSGRICTVINGSGTVRAADVTNVRVVCASNTSGGVTLSGRIAVPPGVMTDNSVNDLNEHFSSSASNTNPVTPQVLPNPISVGGYVNQPWAGAFGRFFFTGNPNDYYQAQLNAGDVIILAIGELNTLRNNLDIGLFDSSGTLVDSSVGTGAYEILTVPSDGSYIINVYARSGASNYILTVGADTTAEAIAAADPGILSTQREIVPGQAVVRFKGSADGEANAQNTASSQAFTQSAAGAALTVLAGAPEREMLLNIDDPASHGSIRIFDTVDTVDTVPPPYGREAAGDPDKERLLRTLLAIAEMRKEPDILLAEPNYIVRSHSMVPNDTHYESQWNLPMISLPEAWGGVTTGSDEVIVAVIDSGVLTSHPDLRNRLTGGYNFVREGNRGIGPDPNDPGDRTQGVNISSFHGTHVAGIIAAETNNGIGTAGVAWRTKIMPVRVMGQGGTGNMYDVRQGIRYAAGMSNDSSTLPEKPADIINLSLGGASFSSADQNLMREVRGRGVIIVAAAGNENVSAPSYPAAYEEVISVGAVNRNGTKASYSNFGPSVDIVAPGGDSGVIQNRILSAGGDDSAGNVVYTYTFKAGTSMAAPHVAGVIALMKAAYPALSPDVLEMLLANGRITNDIGNPNHHGHGLINAFKAVAAAQELAGSGTVVGLNVSPRTLNFGIFTSNMAVSVSKIGTGDLSITGYGSNAEWLAVTRDDSADGDGFGRYNLRADRSLLLHDGSHRAVVTFTASSGESASVGVTVQVRSGDVTYDAGYHYVLLYMVNDNGSIEGAANDIYEVKAHDGYYDYVFYNVQPHRRYLIVAGSDRSNSGWLGEGGESFGAYPTVEQMTAIEVLEWDINGLDFTTNLRLSISNSSMDADNIIPIQR